MEKIKKGKYIQAGVYAAFTVCGIYFLAICCLFKDIAISVGVLKTSAVIVVRNIRILFMPFAEALLLVIWVSVWVANFSLLVSTGDIKQPKAGSQLKIITLDVNQQRMAYG